MTVFLLIREDQNQYGYVDSSVAGVFREHTAAKAQEALERLEAGGRGLLVEDDKSPDGEWQVSWTVQEHEVS